ncbi:MAG: hypothetical protein J6C28_05890 [Bacilli bacterium]|nr:hypothetical protein [Bacilli bacterium]
MKKETIKKVKKSIWLSHGFILLVNAIIIWTVLYMLFSNTSILKDLARVINDGVASPVKITWGIFWIIMPIIMIVQFIGSLISFASVEDKKKEKEVKSKRKKK